MHTYLMRISIFSAFGKALASTCLFGFVGLIFGCSNDSPAARTPASAEALGTRSYKLDPGGAAVQISISGSPMGTPDTTKFSYLMRMFKNAGELVTVSEKDAGSDGGITICGIFSASADRDAVYEVLRSTETDAKSTNFIARSVSACAN